MADRHFQRTWALIRGPEKITDKTKILAGDLLVAILLSILILLFTLVPPLSALPVRIPLGLLMVLFLPGYALIAALFPRKDDLDGIERLALSFGLSIAVVPLIGLGLNYTPWGIHLDSIVVCLTIFTVACSYIANQRRHELAAGVRFSVDRAKLEAIIKDMTFNDKTAVDKAL